METCRSYSSQLCFGDWEELDPGRGHHLAIGWTQLHFLKISLPSARGNPAWWNKKISKRARRNVMLIRLCHVANREESP
jgi:hypothetical protein